ncbi:DUF4377 domain-containing protein [Lewinella sp. JB7]|uniref:DUF4377 domain-containing protein n=1 Tax=Lewinella sp. JB7 TaxID=2962887 RepID=UPI0020CA1C86|nr:DUF4377 domain-containing protein [Lewinella sp. JB7]MCP9236615.1 DUF4377 domain-containing protein [Lewinella sp. JB7]
MKSLAALLTLVSLVAIAVACTSTTNRVLNSTITTYWINSHTVPCTGAGQQMCLQIKRGPQLSAGEWTYFYQSIAGFDFQPGFVYKLSVRETPLIDEETPADGSSMEYTLIRILEKNPDPTLRLNDIWALESVLGQPFDPTTTEMQHPTIEFHLSEQRVMGTNGCNTFNGTLRKADQGKLEFGPLATTRKACPGNDLPDRVMEALNRVAGYVVGENELTLLDRGDKELLRYRKVD